MLEKIKSELVILLAQRSELDDKIQQMRTAYLAIQQYENERKAGQKEPE